MNPNVQLRKERFAAAKQLGTHTQEQWQKVLAEFPGRCVRCGEFGVKITKDHIIPIHDGGSDSIENLQPLCRACNTGRNYYCEPNWLEERRTNGWEMKCPPLRKHIRQLASDESDRYLRLADAAPDLLTAAQDLLYHIERGDWLSPERLTAIRAAITKATT